MSVAGPVDAVPVRGRVNRLLLDAWFAARKDAILPCREDLKASAVKLILPLMVILDYRSADEAICLMMGTRLREILGFEGTGLNLFALGPESVRTARKRRFQLCAEQPCGFQAAAEISVPNHVGTRSVELLVLPLRTAADGGLQFIAVGSAVGDEISVLRGDRVDNRDSVDAIARNAQFINLGAGVPQEML